MARYSFDATETAEQIAIALSRRLGVPIRKDQVEVEPLPEAGQYLVTVYEAPQSIKRIIPYVNDTTPITLDELCTIGYRTNRKPCLMNPYRHGQVIAATESGKTSLLHTMLAHITRCPNVVIWIGGVWKLYDFVGQWLEPYLDTGIVSPFDWVAHGHQDVRNMMAAALNISAYRMNLRMNQRGGLPKIVLILDEVTYIVGDRYTTANVGGVDMKADELIAGIARGTAGAGIYEWLATQRDTQDNLGDQGGTTIAQMGFTIVGAIRDQGTVGRVLDDWKVSPPKRKGEFWVDTGSGDGLAKVNAAYIQSSDPDKPKLHDGPTVGDVGWSRRSITHVLDPGSAQAAGLAYESRHKLVTDDMLTYLTTEGRSTRAASNLSSGTAMLGSVNMAEIAEAERDFELMVRRAAATGTDNAERPLSDSELAQCVEQLATEHTNYTEAATEPTGTATDIAVYRTRVDRVKGILRAGSTPLTRAEILEELAALGDAVTNPQTVTNICSSLVKPGTEGAAAEFGRTDDGRYYAHAL